MAQQPTKRVVLAKATEVFGGREAAKTWLSTPAMAFDYKRPVELLTTPAGIQDLERLLWQLEYGVYI